MPVTLTSSVAIDTDSNYNVTVTKDGAVIKTATIVMPANQTSTTATIANIPATETGIDYVVTVESESNDFVITTPDKGVTSVKGIKGQDVALNFVSSKQLDVTIDTGLVANVDKMTVFDVIELAKANGAVDAISNSDVITLKYSFVNDGSSSGHIDLISGTPSKDANTSGSATPGRFMIGRLYQWNQYDIIDSTAEGYYSTDGSWKSTENQWLNSCGKFKNGVKSTLTVTIDYKNKTVLAKGEGSGEGQELKEHTFAFPTEAKKGDLKLVVYYDKHVINITDMEVTYKEAVTTEADTSSLKTKVEEAKAIEKGTYTTATWDALQTLIAEAEAMIADPTSCTTVQAREKFDAITKAIAGLKNTVAATATFSALEADDILGKSTDDIQGALVVKTTDNTVSVEGISFLLDSYNGYEEGASGNFVAVKMDIPTGVTVAENTTIIKLGEKNVTSASLDNDGKSLYIVLKVTGNDMTKDITVDWDGEDDSYSATTYTFVFDKLFINTAENFRLPSNATFAAAEKTAKVDEKTVADYQYDIEAALNGNTVNVTGKSFYLNSKNGNNVVLTISVPGGVTVAEDKTLVTIGETTYDSTKINAETPLTVVLDANANATVKVDWDGDGVNYLERTYTVDFSKLDKENLTSATLDIADPSELSGSVKDEGANLGYTNGDFMAMYLNPGSFRTVKSGQLMTSLDTSKYTANATVEFYLTSATKLADFDAEENATKISGPVTITSEASTGWGVQVPNEFTFDTTNAQVDQVNLVMVVTKLGGNYAGGNYHGMTLTLDNTVDGPTPKPIAVKKDDLNEAISKAEALNEADYTSETWVAVTTALAAAKTVTENADATQAQVDEAAKKLNDAIAALEEVNSDNTDVDKTALNEAISKAEALNEADYTSETWAAVTTALAAAKTVTKNADATQAQIDEAKTALTAAIDGLKSYAPSKLYYNADNAAIDGTFNVNTDGSIDNTGKSVKVLFTKPGLLDKYTAISIRNSNNNYYGNATYITANVYLTSAADVADVTDENKTAIASPITIAKVGGWTNYTDNIALLDTSAIAAAVEAGQSNIYVEYSTDGSQVSNFDYIALLDSTVNSITISNAITNGTVVSDTAKTIAGQTVTLTVRPNEGYKLKDNSLTVTYGEESTVTLKEVNDTTYTFIMPEGAVTVSAEFEALPQTDKTALNTAIESAIEAYNKSAEIIYTTESLAALRGKIEAAAAVYANDTAEQTEVNAAAATLENPENSLVAVYEITTSAENATVTVTSPEAYTAPIYAAESYQYKNADEMTTVNGHPQVENDTNLGYTDVDFEVMFKNVGSLDCYSAINLPVGGGSGNNASCTVKVYLTSAADVASMTESNSAVIVDTITLNNGANSTGWSDYVDTVIAIDTADVDDSFVNLVVEFNKTSTYCGNMVEVKFSKTPIAIDGFTAFVASKVKESGKFYASANDTVTFTATANDTYALGDVKVNNGDALTANDNVYTFTMPAADAVITASTAQ